MKHPKPRPKRKPKVRCANHGPWSFVQTDKGMRRTCSVCGLAVVETTNRAPSGGGAVIKSRDGDIST